MKRFLCCIVVLLLVVVLLPTMSVQAEAKTVSVGIPVEERPELFTTRSMPTHGKGKIAVFLIDFPDYPNENPVATQKYYDKLYFSGGLDTVWGKTTVADFYNRQSYGKLNLSGQVFDWYTAKHERSYYDGKKAELVMEAAEHYRSQGVDFAQFDGDGDGVIDSIVYHFAGEVTEERNAPWYPGLCMYRGGQIGELKFTTIVQVTENANIVQDDTIRTVCHELMHTLGLPDLYSEVTSGLMSASDLMSTNENILNPYFKILLGWVDTVQVITGAMDDVRLDVFEESGNVAVVTDEFNGFFDEFYVVAYRKQYFDANAIIWHIDARLNEDATAFAYQNLYYDPRPDKENSHREGYVSEYLFVEEISADPDYDRVVNDLYVSPDVVFGEDSVLGPNNMPSSDMHDGSFTGIQIHGFTEHDETYLTFAVSFVEDTAAPVIVTEEASLEFKKTIKIKFNEHIYTGENWAGVQVTDLDGNPLDVTILRPHYPCDEVEITFKSNAYEAGYQVMFPEGAVKDSSGNGLKAVTLTASKERYLFPSSQTQLPNPGYWRSNSDGYFFPVEDGFVVITGLWASNPQTLVNVRDAKIEFMRLDNEGNVLAQKVMDNPVKNYIIQSVQETGDGCYIVFCKDNSKSYQWIDVFFCIDQNGDLKWINQDYQNTDQQFYGYTSVKRDNGLVTRLVGKNAGDKRVVICSENGAVQDFVCPINDELFYLSNGKILGVQKRYGAGKAGNILQIMDADTYGIEAQGELLSPTSEPYNIHQVHDNIDGTILLLCWQDGDVEVLLLDAGLQLIKSVCLEEVDGDSTTLNWLGDDGFCEIDRVLTENHGHGQFHVRRYDRYLNLVWETDVIANFVYYFKSASGEIMGYKSMLDPERECYIEHYGSETVYRSEHKHRLLYTEGIPATCLSEGRAEYWYCTDCGCRYLDKGQTLLTDLKMLVTPIADHIEITDEAVAATCTTTGLTEGKHCAVCNEVLIKQKKIDKLAHTEAIDEAVAATCTQTGKTEGKKCIDCGQVLLAQQTVPKVAHKEENVPEVSATCTEPGKTAGVRCSVCKAVLSGVANIPVKSHDFGPWTVIEQPTTETAGLEQRSCRSCGKTNQRQIGMLEPEPTVPVTPPSEPSQPTAPLQPTEPSQPTQPITPTTKPTQPTVQTNPTTNPTEPGNADPAPNDKTVLIVIICAVAVIGGSGTAAVLLIKRKKG